MLQENYTLIIPPVFAIIAMLVKLASRREGDKSPKINDTCIGQSLIVGALSASLAFAVTAQKAISDMNKSIKEKAAAVSQARDRKKAEKSDIDDEALIQVFSKEIGQVVGQVSNRSEVVEKCLVLVGVCIALVLFFALVDRYRAFKEQESSSLFRVTDFKDLGTLAVKLQNAQDPLSPYLKDQLSPGTRTRVEAYNSNSPGPVHELLKRDLVKELNQLLKAPDFFNERRFDQVELTEEIRKLLKPQGETLVRLNRLLLEEAYPHAIAKSQVKEGFECKRFQRKRRWWLFVNAVGLFGFVFVLWLTRSGK